ncbi:fibronectin type III domain-containing protein [Psychromicrobium lacuslunae]|uniref:fibronectin type III domain-containing protein n=1 Tax=Psychromicrobium lacuslunae TaxID=1618207 RepID=UPI001F40510D|nr:fibronectin type III domain-containing protein [Psychromicrobium lacuslunae]
MAAVPGKGQGSNQWGFAGDIETSRGASDSTFSYGVAISPTDGSLWVTDSGKVGWSSLLCQLAGLGAPPCQFGTPSIAHYPANGTVSSDYLGGGNYQATGYTASPGVNAGLGARFAPLAESDQKTFPAAEKAQHGPRGIVVDGTGTAWVVDSEANSPDSGPAQAIKRFAPDFSSLPGAGFTGSWAQTATPGYLNYRAGISVDSSGTVWVDNQVRDALDGFNPDGSVSTRVKLDVPAGTYSATDPGYRNPYGVAIDQTDDSYYLPLINFRDDPGLRNTPFIEKRDKSGKIIATFGQNQLTKGQVVFGSYVDQVTRHVYAWSGADTSSSALFEYTKDGEFIRSYTSSQFPGLTNIRGVATDSRGYLYVTVGQGSASTRVMVLAQTPSPVNSVCAARSVDKSSVSLSWNCDGPSVEGAQYSKAPVLDYVIESREIGGTSWSVIPHPPSTAQNRVISGLDPTKEYEFRVSAWNEAGNGDWASAQAVLAKSNDDLLQTSYHTSGSVDVLANDSFDANLPAVTTSLLDAQGSAVSELTVAGEGKYTLAGSVVTFSPEAGFHGQASPLKYRVSYADNCFSEALIRVQVGDPAMLTLVKKVDGDSGAAEPSAWSLSATAQDGSVVSGISGSSEVTRLPLTPGRYALAETGPTRGYQTAGFICVTGDGDPAAADSAVTLLAGQDTVCTVTNSYTAATVTPSPTASPSTSTSTPSPSTPTSTASSSQPAVPAQTSSQHPSAAESDPEMPETGFTAGWLELGLIAVMIGSIVLFSLKRRTRQH